jgi:hypothetical protein
MALVAARAEAGELVTFCVGSQTFRVSLTTADLVAGPRAAQSGSLARIPNGRIVPCTQVNVGWSWHLEDVMFAEGAIELRWTTVRCVRNTYGLFEPLMNASRPVLI